VLDDSVSVIDDSGATPYIYALSGRTTSSAPTNAVYYTSINTSTGDVAAWSTSSNSLPSNLFSHTAQIMTNSSTPTIYVEGGRPTSSTTQATVYVSKINTSTHDVNAWTTSSQPMPIALNSASSAVFDSGTNGYIFVLGGQTNSSVVKSGNYSVEQPQLGSTVTQSAPNNIQVDYTNVLSTASSLAQGIDETAYVSGHDLSNDSLEQTRIKALNPQIMRMSLKYLTPGDTTSRIICEASGCDHSVTADAWINAVKATGSTAEIQVPLSAVDAAAIVKHFNVDTNNYVGRWIVFNEPDINGSNAASYSASFNTIYDAMKAVDPTIKIGGPALSAYSSSYFNTFLQTSGGRTDFVDFHEYGEGNQQPEDTLMGNTVAFEQNLNALRNQVNTLVASRSAQIGMEMGEWSLTYNAGDPNEFDNFATTWTASIFGRILRTGAISRYYGTHSNLLFGAADPGHSAAIDDYKPAYFGLGAFMGEGLFPQFGRTIVSANSYTNNIEVYASDSPKDLVVINKDATSSATGNFDLLNNFSGVAQVWRKDQTMNQYALPTQMTNATVSNGQFSYSLTPHSVSTFVLYQAPTAPSSLAQYKSDGITSISSGGLTNETSVTFKFQMTSPNSSDTLTPQVEVVPIGSSFTNIPTSSGSAVTYNGNSVLGIATVSGLLNGTSYHWQASSSNVAGNTAWTANGGNPDFRVDTTPPIISAVTATPSATSAVVTWSTNEAASSIVDYGLTNTYGTTTSEADLSPRVTSHSVTLTGLTSCQTYHVRAKSNDAAGNLGAGTDNSFTTTCTATLTPTPTTSNNSSTANISIPITPSCADLAPGSNPPSLYAAVPQASGAIALYFTAGDGPVDNYALEFGTGSGNYQYGSGSIGSAGARTYLVQLLQPTTKYYFRIRGGHGCATGPWSNEISDSTLPLASINHLAITTTALEALPASPQSSPVQSNPVASQVFPDSENVTASPTSPSPIPTPTSTAIPPAQPSKTYQMKVKVLDKQKKPVQGAAVTIHSTPQTAFTDQNGIATFSNVEAGQHQVLIAYNGYTGQQSVDLSGDAKEIDLNVQVRPEIFQLSALSLAIIGSLLIAVAVLLVLLLKKQKSIPNLSMNLTS